MYCRTFWLLRSNFEQEQLLQALSKYRPIFKEKKPTSPAITISPPSFDVLIDEDKEGEVEESEKEGDPLEELKR